MTKRFFTLAIFSFFVLAVYSVSVYSEGDKRIVSLAPSVTEILYAIGAGDQVVGVTTYCEFPPEATSKPKVGGFTNHNLESIILQKPDLVMIVPNGGTKATFDKLEQIGIKTMVIPFYGLNDLLESFETIGKEAGRAEEGARLRQRFNVLMEQVRIRSASRPRKKVAFVMWNAPLIVPGDGTIESDIVQLAGGDNAAKNMYGHYPRFNMESFFNLDPDLIIDASNMGKKELMEKRRKRVRQFWEKYRELRAVKTGHVFIFKTDVYCVPGPRTERLIQAMDALLDPNTDPDANEFYERVKI